MMEYFGTALAGVAGLTTAYAQDLQSNEPKRRAQALLAEAWRYDHLATSSMADSSEVAGLLEENGPAKALDYAQRAVECFETGLQLLGPQESKNFVSRMKQRNRSARHAMLYAHFAAAHLHSNEGDITNSLEMALTHYESALSIAKNAGHPELYGWLLTQVGSACLVYPTEHEDLYTRRAIGALEDAQQAFAPYVPAWLKVRGGFGSGRLTDLAVFSWTLLPKLMKARWRRSIPGTLLLDFINPSFMARLHSGLGVAYSRLGELGKGLQQFDLALTFLPEDSDEERVGIEVGKGLAYLTAGRDDRLANLKAGLKCLRKGMAQNADQGRRAASALHYTRGCLERDTLDEPNPKTREKNLDTYTRNLRVVARIARRVGMDAVLREALVLLGRVAALQGDSERSYRALALAARVAERLHATARTPRLKNYGIGRSAEIYELLLRVSFAYFSRKGSDARWERTKEIIARCALALAERGRTRLLQEELASRHLLPRGAKAVEVEEFLMLRKLRLGTELKFLELESGFYGGAGTEFIDRFRSRRNAIERAYSAALAQIRTRFNDPTYDPDEPMNPVRFVEISKTLQALSSTQQTAIVEYYITDEQLLAFVLLPADGANPPRFAFLDTGISREELDKIEDHWSRGYAKLRSREQPIQVVHWEGGYLAQTLDRLSRAITVPWGVLRAWEKDAERCIARVIVIPHRFLHLVPLHAARLPDGRAWGDAVSIQYVPSASVLSRLACHHELSDTSAESAHPALNVLAIAYQNSTAPETPKRKLVFNLCEARAVAHTLGGKVLEDGIATPQRIVDEMQNAAYVHFACHGAFDENAPLESALELAPDGEVRTAELEPHGSPRLTLGEIFERVHLPHTELVVLSACETGIPKVEEDRDEYIGLPAGFLFAGARTVVSTLWSVEDVATWLLMRSMAQGLARGARPTDALRFAQHALRQLEACQVAQEIDEVAAKEDDLERREHMLEESRRMREEARSNPYPYATPYWWAGFTVNGLG